MISPGNDIDFLPADGFVTLAEFLSLLAGSLFHQKPLCDA